MADIEYSYDKKVYSRLSFPYTRPEAIRAIAALKGIKAPKVNKAKILDLGCAIGDNLFSFAELYPEAKLVGVDLSAKQIELGKDVITKAGIKNCELKAMSILDIDESFSKFDYIICHGVFSWVPDNVKDKIIEICKNNLTENGVAYISYNTFPGWNMTNSLKDLLRYHTASFSDEGSKIIQARLCMEFFEEIMQEQDLPYAKSLLNEIRQVKANDDSYIYHEYLEGENKPFYLHEFSSMLTKQGLKYFGDVSLVKEYANSISAKGEKSFAEIQDRIHREQYVDFINNNKFRCSLLCHDHQEVTNNIPVKDLDDLYLSVRIHPEIELKDTDITDGKQIKFRLNLDKNRLLDTNNEVVKAILYTLYESNSYPLKFTEIAKLSLKKCKTKNIDLEAVKMEMYKNLPNLILKSVITITSEKPEYLNVMSKKPKVSSYVRYQVSSGYYPSFIINMASERIKVGDLIVVLLNLMDGKHSLDAIKAKIYQMIKSGAMNFEAKEKDESKRKQLIEELVDLNIEEIKKYKILVA